MFIEPGHQWQVVRHTPEQRHGRMPVHIDKSGQDHMVGQVNHFPGPVGLVGIGLRHNRFDPVTQDQHRLVFQHLAKWLHWNQPAGIDADISGYDGVSGHGSGLLLRGDEYCPDKPPGLPAGQQRREAYGKLTGSWFVLKGRV